MACRVFVTIIYIILQDKCIKILIYFLLSQNINSVLFHLIDFATPDAPTQA